MVTTNLSPAVKRFFRTFSRFEYALKRAGNVRSRGSNEAAEVDWSGFAGRTSAAFDAAININDESALAQAVHLMRADPPRKLVLIKEENGERLYWKRSDPRGDNLDGLLTLVRRVRNNLFHGEKPETFIGGNQRGLELIKASQQIVDVCISLDPDVKRYFERYAEPIPRLNE